METPNTHSRSPPRQNEPDLKKTKISSTTTSDIQETTAAHNNSNDDDSASKTKNETEEKKQKRYKRRKIAIFFAYCGVGYQGMQKNPGAKTIEGELEQALYHSGAVPDEERGAPRRYDWSRSARTDKGVSAVGQVVSGSFYVDPPGLVDRLNAFLPHQIRIFGFKRTTPSFSAKTFCYRRRYVYLIPVFALDPSRHCGRETVLSSSGSGVELVKCSECSERGREVEGLAGSKSNSGNGNETVMSEELDSKVVEDGIKGDFMEDGMAKIAYTGEDVKKEENDADGEEMPVDKENFSYGVQERERFNRILNYYVGTHNFHNFTSRTKAQDPSAKRYIVSFNANTTVTVEGIQFVKCEVVGQSFMLHQIRNMIGLAVAIMRNCAPESLIETAFRKDVNINVPMAPEVGLYLDECFFTSYNQKFKKTHEELSMKSYEKEAEDFKMKYIYSHIASTENKEGVVALWLHYLNHRDYPDLRFPDSRETVEGKGNTCKATAGEIAQGNSAGEEKMAGEILEEKCAAEKKMTGEIPEDVTGQEKMNGKIPDYASGQDKMNAEISEDVSGHQKINGEIPKDASGQEKMNGEIPEDASGQEKMNGEIPEDASGQEKMKGEIPEDASGQDKLNAEIPEDVSGQQKMNGEIPEDVSGQQIMSREIPEDVSGQQIMNGEIPEDVSGQQKME